MSTSQTIPSLHKAISVLEMLGNRTDAVSVKEISYALNIPPATCYRMVRTLTAHDLLHEDPAGGLRIGFGVVKLARSYSEIEYALHELRTPLQQLSQTLDLSTKFTLREGHWGTTVLRAEPTSPNAITSPVGHRFHLTQGSAATALLSTLTDREIDRVIETAPENVWTRQTPEQVREGITNFRKTGIAKDLGTQHPSIYAVSMLVHLPFTDPVSVSVVGLPEDFISEKRKVIIQQLLEAVNEMNRLTGGIAK